MITNTTLRNREREAGEPGDGEYVGGDEQFLLVVLPPAETVIRARGDQQHRRDRGGDEGDEEDVPVDLAELGEAVCERNGEEECEQHLHAWKGHPELVQELDQLSVVTIFLALFGHGVLFQPSLPVETRVLLDRAEDALDDARSRHHDATCAVRKLVDSLLLRILRIDIDPWICKVTRAAISMS